MDITYIGLGKMGQNMVLRMLEKGHTVLAYDPSEEARTRAAAAGVTVVSTLEELMAELPAPRIVWLMVPHTVVDSVLDELSGYLASGDTVIDGGNSPFKETVRRAREHDRRGIRFLDAGVSGGPSGARHGACIMVGGAWDVYKEYEELFTDLATTDGSAYMGLSGAGHFVKMVHNGIEYGMMQAIAEGFDVMRRSAFDLPLTDIAHLYNHGSVVESRLVGWLLAGFEAYGEDLAGITGSANATGEAAWTVETAHDLDVPTRVIEESLAARERSQKKPSYQGQVISVMRNQFGGHDAGK
jgi:6-phosphogluconate dehydrogenase